MSSEGKGEVRCPPPHSAVATARPSTPSRRSASARAAGGPSTRSTTVRSWREPSAASRSRPARRRSGATPPLLPVEAPAEQRLAPGLTPLVRAPRLAEAARARRAVPEARHRQPDALLQGPRRRRRGREGPGARPDDARLLLDRQPRQRGRCPRGRRGHRRGGLLPRRPRAREADGDGRLRRDASTPSTGTYDDCSRLTIELSFELPWAFVNVGLRSYYAEGSKTLAYEIAEQLGWELPDVVVAPIASGSLYTKLNQGFCGPARARPRRGRASRASIGGQAAGCAPVATAFADGGPGAAGAARHGRALARDRQPRRRRPRRRHRAAPRAARSTRSPRRRSASAWRCSPRRRACSARPPPASRSARSARRSPPASVGPDDRVVLLVTGDGLKTPGPRRRPSPAGPDRGRRGRPARPARRRPEHAKTSLPKATLLFEANRSRVAAVAGRAPSRHPAARAGLGARLQAQPGRADQARQEPARDPRRAAGADRRRATSRCPRRTWCG